MPGPPPGGTGAGPPLQQQHQAGPGQQAVAPAWAGHGVSAGTTTTSRPFSQIISEESANRNIIQLHLSKTPIIENGQSTQPKSLNYDELGEFLFDILKIDPEACLSLDLSTGRYDTR